MKTKFFLFFTWVMLIATSCSAENTPIDEPEVPTTNEPSEPPEPAGDKKVLVVYFSHTGNTRTIAGYIHNAVETAAPPIRTFLTTHDLAGKTVVPFCTSGTSSAEASYRLVRSLCPQSTVLEGIQIRRGTYDTALERVGEWLRKIGVVEYANTTNHECQFRHLDDDMRSAPSLYPHSACTWADSERS